MTRERIERMVGEERADWLNMAEIELRDKPDFHPQVEHDQLF